ncbi:MAG: MarR family transcriptional regulator [Propionibacteriaceae bacterium]|jgi:DNA-binding MarR family transcriptional regulator|nr:MarR family transcriptional regulator [Propionibacteriaceae bacterium]
MNIDLSDKAQGFDGPTLVFGGVFAVANRLQRLLDAHLPELTSRQWWALVMLSLFDEPPTLTQLSAAMDTSHQSLKTVLNHLEKLGFVQIVPDQKDTRALRIIATEKVARWSEGAAEAQSEFMAAMFAGISEEESLKIGQALVKLHENLGEMESNRR